MTQPALCLHDGLVTEHYDVIIVGSGAGGGTLAHPKPVFVDGKYSSKDTSFFPSIGAVNPALTAMANAIRVGEHLMGRMS
jgi:choline dehydrogenase-like flavoprotein